MADEEDREVPVPEDATMRVTDVYSYNGAVEKLRNEHPEELQDVFEIIEEVSADDVFVKESGESQYSDIYLASPVTMNYLILVEGLYHGRGWAVDHGAARGKHHIEKIGREPESISEPQCALDIASGERWGKRTVDALRKRVAVEIQFGKYAFMMYDVLAKFGHFRRADRMDVGIELVPSNQLYQTMSSGPGYYIDDTHRNPVLVMGVGFERPPVHLEDIEDNLEQYSMKKLSDY